jgi:CHASE3 domain sensor protein
MMMNIRALIMDDPEHTEHLQTLQFAIQTKAQRSRKEQEARHRI